MWWRCGPGLPPLRGPLHSTQLTRCSRSQCLLNEPARSSSHSSNLDPDTDPVQVRGRYAHSVACCQTYGVAHSRSCSPAFCQTHRLDRQQRPGKGIRRADRRGERRSLNEKSVSHQSSFDCLKALPAEVLLQGQLGILRFQEYSGG